MKNVGLILLYDSQKRFLLQHRTDNAPVYPGLWGFFGGAIEDGETPEVCVKRECFEELEYKLENPKLVFNSVIDCQYGQRNLYVFLEKFNPEQKIILCEGQGMRWIGEEEIKSLKLIDYQIKILKKMYNIIKDS